MTTNYKPSTFQKIIKTTSVGVYHTSYHRPIAQLRHIHRRSIILKDAAEVGISTRLPLLPARFTEATLMDSHQTTAVVKIVAFDIDAGFFVSKGKQFKLRIGHTKGSALYEGNIMWRKQGLYLSSVCHSR